jgi:hypothetical protein
VAPSPGRPVLPSPRARLRLDRASRRAPLGEVNHTNKDEERRAAAAADQERMIPERKTRVSYPPPLLHISHPQHARARTSSARGYQPQPRQGTAPSCKMERQHDANRVISASRRACSSSRATRSTRAHPTGWSSKTRAQAHRHRQHLITCIITPWAQWFYPRFHAPRPSWHGPCGARTEAPLTGACQDAFPHDLTLSGPTSHNECYQTLASTLPWPPFSVTPRPRSAGEDASDGPSARAGAVQVGRLLPALLEPSPPS